MSISNFHLHNLKIYIFTFCTEHRIRSMSGTKKNIVEWKECVRVVFLFFKTSFRMVKKVNVLRTKENNRFEIRTEPQILLALIKIKDLFLSNF